MSIFTTTKEIPSKFLGHIEKLKVLLKKYDVDGFVKLTSTYKNNIEFQNEWKDIWLSIAKEDGGKLSLTTIGVILGAVLGGVGIAAMGGAIGMPLALVLGLTGFISGSFVDDNSISVNLPSELASKLKSDADELGISVDEILEYLVRKAYEDNTENNIIGEIKNQANELINHKK